MKETEARPGEWVAISGIGGLGRVAVQYAKAMGLHDVALDVTEDKLVLARSLGADVVVNAKSLGAAEGHGGAVRPAAGRVPEADL